MDAAAPRGAGGRFQNLRLFKEMDDDIGGLQGLAELAECG